ncbi:MULTISPECIES: hypothetical protein [Amycolatopsis]|uniref:Dihydroorotase n=1 Tax=Amycolatopsis albidoflavus TaxID=102226 RepID=A0ABW5I944_9PSEU
MKNYDLVVRGGRVTGPGGVRLADIAVTGGKSPTCSPPGAPCPAPRKSTPPGGTSCPA